MNQASRRATWITREDRGSVQKLYLVSLVSCLEYLSPSLSGSQRRSFRLGIAGGEIIYHTGIFVDRCVRTHVGISHATVRITLVFYIHSGTVEALQCSSCQVCIKVVNNTPKAHDLLDKCYLSVHQGYNEETRGTIRGIMDVCVPFS